MNYSGGFNIWHREDFGGVGVHNSLCRLPNNNFNVIITDILWFNDSIELGSNQERVFHVHKTKPSSLIGRNC